MLHQLFDIPHDKPFLLACSGGVDSMAIADFYLRGNKTFQLAYFHHGTVQATQMLEAVFSFSEKRNIQVLIGKIERDRNKDESPEEYWRNERYRWLLSHNLPIVTAHTLDDCVETWIFSSLHGNPKVINPIANNDGIIIYRPFILNRKIQFIEWCTKNNVSWTEDKSNLDVKFPRNRIRHNIISECLKINPGLHKVIKKKIINNFKNEHSKIFNNSI